MNGSVLDASGGVVVAVGDDLSGAVEELLDLHQRHQELIRVVLCGFGKCITAFEEIGVEDHGCVPSEECGYSEQTVSEWFNIIREGKLECLVLLQRCGVKCAKCSSHLVKSVFRPRLDPAVLCDGRLLQYDNVGPAIVYRPSIQT